MKTKRQSKVYGRQGDIALLYETQPIKGSKAIPRERGRLVLAHGEVTGHTHGIDAQGAALYLDDATTAQPDVMARLLTLGGGVMPDAQLRAKAGTKVTHDEHGTIPTRGRGHTVRRQIEYSPRELRSVAD
jgi:hypothetical protein